MADGFYLVAIDWILTCENIYKQQLRFYPSDDDVLVVQLLRVLHLK